MSYWTHIKGIVQVEPMGRTQPEKEYILKTALEHLPRVTGSEGDMDTHIVKRKGYNCSSSCDEFGYRTNNLIDCYGTKTRNGMLNTQDVYFIIVDGALKDRCFDETYREFINWLCRLAKRVQVTYVLTNVISDEKTALVLDDCSKFIKIWEEPSWYVWHNSNPYYRNWREYLSWKW